MDKCKILMFLLAAVICLASFSAGFAMEMKCPVEDNDPATCIKQYCSVCSVDPSDINCTACMESCNEACGGSGSGDISVVVVLPEDGTGEYYVDENGKKQYVSYKSWDECMKVFGDWEKCSTIVTDDCQSCLGTCQAYKEMGMDTGIITCSDLCSDKCTAGASDSNCPTQGGTDAYGEYYYENCRKKYSGFNDFSSCWSIMGDVKSCVAKNGYGCFYNIGFYISNICDSDDIDCSSRILSDYIAQCGGYLF